MGGTHFLQTGYLLLNRNAPYAFHYCVSDTLVYYFVVSGVFAFPSQLLSVLTFCISSLSSPNYFDYQSIYLQYTTKMLFCQHLFYYYLYTSFSRLGGKIRIFRFSPCQTGIFQIK